MIPSYIKCYSVEEAELALGLKFKGVGWYKLKETFVLVSDTTPDMNGMIPTKGYHNFFVYHADPRQEIKSILEFPLMEG